MRDEQEDLELDARHPFTPCPNSHMLGLYEDEHCVCHRKRDNEIHDTEGTATNVAR